MKVIFEILISLDGMPMKRTEKVNKRIDFMVSNPYKIDKLNTKIRSILHKRDSNYKRLKIINELKRDLVQKYFEHKQNQ